MDRLNIIQGGRSGAQNPSSARPGPAGLVEELYRRYAPAVFARCRYLLRSTEAAKDATQDVFAKALSSLPEFRSAGSQHVWLMQVASNHCFNVLRAGRAAWHDELRKTAGLERGLDLDLQGPDARELVRALLLAAPEEAREVAVLYYVDEMTQAEIAQLTGRSLPTVRKRLREFLAAARAALAEACPGISLPHDDDSQGGEP